MLAFHNWEGENTSEEDFEKGFSSNVKRIHSSVFKLPLPKLKPEGGGSILNCILSQQLLEFLNRSLLTVYTKADAHMDP